MAKAKIKGLDEAIEEIFKDYKKVIKDAAQEATEKAKDDLYANAVSCLVAYYDDYDPTSYNRTYSLIKSFVPYAKDVQEDVDGFLCVAGVEFDPSKLEDVYYGSAKYSPADPEWILDNFLQGKHGEVHSKYTISNGSFIPADEMQNYVNNYYNTFDYYFRRSISKQILRTIRR